MRFALSKHIIILIKACCFFSLLTVISCNDIFSQQTPDSITTVDIGYGSINQGVMPGSASIISGSAFSGMPSASFDKNLQGLASGVMVTSVSGSPGSGANLNIMGIGSFNSGTEPLYVIDGIPISSGALITGISPLAYIAPGDIESVTILKDASLTAIYGSRGANGVVIVNTKRGQRRDKNEVHISAESFSGFSSFPKQLPVMNADQYSKYIRILHDSAGDNQNFYAYTSDSARLENGMVNTNWQKLITEEVAPVYGVKFLVHGGGRDHNFAIGVNDYGETGTLINNYYKRLGLRANSDLTLFKRWLRLGESFNVNRSNNQSTPNYLSTALTVSPLMPIYNANNEGGYMGPETRYVGNHDQTNPVCVMNLDKTQGTNTRVLSNLYAEITPASIGFLKGLTYRVDFGYDYMISNTRNFIPIYNLPTNGNRSHSVAELNQSNAINRMWKVNNLLSYANSFGQEDENKVKPHNISLMVGQEVLEFRRESFNVRAMNFPSGPDYPVFAQALESTLPSGSISSYKMNSCLGRFLYDYKGKYYLLVNVRNDFSSGTGFLPGVSAGWKISDDFFKNINQINSVNLHAGWGKAANNSLLSNYVSYNNIYEPRYPLGSYYLYPTASPRLDEITTWDYGFDLLMFQNSIRFSTNYYVKNIQSWSNTMALTANSGSWMNYGSMQNRGFEFNMNYRKQIGEVAFNIAANLTTIRNEIKSMNYGSLLTSYGNNYTSYTTPGNSIGSIYGYVCEGIFTSQEQVDKHATQDGAEPGDLIFKDLNGDQKIDANDRTIIGKTIPDYFYGITFSCAWKGLDAIVFLQGVQNVDVYNQTRAFLLSPGNFADYNKLEDAMDYWSPENPNSAIPRIDKIDANRNGRCSSYFVEDGSYLRVKNIQIGYTFLRKPEASIENRGIRIYLSLMNYYTFTKYKGYDPEIARLSSYVGGYDNGTYPVPKTVIMGVQFNF